ncbi:MAG: methionine adenosyltransferase [Bdellovibrionota bacterium]
MRKSTSDFLFTSESVTEGHPDKVADLISDTILDAYIEQDPSSRVACETLVTTGLAVVAGEISTQSKKEINVEELVRSAIRHIGYDRAEEGFTADSCKILNHLHEQSADIAVGVDRGEEIGAGDQGLMFGYACTETPDLMPVCISLAHKISYGLSQKRKSKEIPWLRPDGKTQVTVEYKDGKPYRIDTVVVSTQHLPDVTHSEIFERVKKEIVEPHLPQELIKGEIKYHINPTGIFVIGGPHGDAGLTGRKIIVDTYGGYAPHGGGAFSGKDPTKVDRSAAYMARYVAKNIVAAGLADRALIQLAYAIGVAEPVSLMVDCQGTEKVDPDKINKAVREIFPMRPVDIIKRLNLRTPIYKRSTNYGHFGRSDAGLSWEKTDAVSELKSIL